MDCLLSLGPRLIGNLVEVDVSSGARQQVKAPRCKNMGYGDWVSAKVLASGR
jgi:hypothetical protein